MDDRPTFLIVWTYMRGLVPVFLVISAVSQLGVCLRPQKSAAKAEGNDQQLWSTTRRGVAEAARLILETGSHILLGRAGPGPLIAP